MPRRGERKPKAPPEGADDSQVLHAWMQRYLEWLRVQNDSARTVENRQLYLGYCIAWCAERGITRPVEVTRPILERYQRMLFHYHKRSGYPLSSRSQHSRLVLARARWRGSTSTWPTCAPAWLSSPTTARSSSPPTV